MCSDVESKPGPGSDKRVRVLYSNIRGLHANLGELAVAVSDHYLLVCAESKVSDRRHLPELIIPDFSCQGAQGMALYVREGFRSFRQSNCWSVLAMNPVCFAFAVG